MTETDMLLEQEFNWEAFEAGLTLKNDVRKRGRPARERDPKWPAWYNGRVVDQIAYIDSLKEGSGLRTINGRLYTIDGRVEDDTMRSRITRDLRPYVRMQLNRTVTSILQTLKDDTHSEPIQPKEDRIHFINGTYLLRQGFTPEKEWTMNRLPIAYDPGAPVPDTWLTFLRELLHEEDIPTLQEYMGYCLIPATRGQAMLLLVGNGGEGKSLIGTVLKQIFGDSMYKGYLDKLESSQFAAANLEGRLLFLDEEMNMAALSSTNIIKALVTCDGFIELEQKNKQAYQALMYARLLCFSNGYLRSLYDRSNGFYRRQIILTTKPRGQGQTDDRFYNDKLASEAPGILLWCLEGLLRLIGNGFAFTVSARARQTKQELIMEDNTVRAFLEDKHCIAFHPKEGATTRMLYDAYCLWCMENGVRPQSINTMGSYLKQHQEELGLSYSHHVELPNARPARGFIGIQVLSSGSNPAGGFRRLEEPGDLPA